MTEYRALHPEKFQPTVLAKRKKPVHAAPGQKLIRREYEDDHDYEDEKSEEGEEDSDYGADRKKSGQRRTGGDLKNY